MEAIRHRVGIKAPKGAVYDMFVTPQGISQWWTREVKAPSDHELAFWFGSEKPGAVVDVEVCEPDRLVVWRCEDGPPEWIDTTITFDIREADGETVVVFTHGGWQEPVEFMHHCSTAWGSFLISLKHELETGTGAPWPDHERVSTWG
jgi:uncharacterized protein YndB with AHSA1/START domain